MGRREHRVSTERWGHVLVHSVRSKGSNDYPGLALRDHRCPNKTEAEELWYTQKRRQRDSREGVTLPQANQHHRHQEREEAGDALPTGAPRGSATALTP